MFLVHILVSFFILIISGVHYIRKKKFKFVVLSVIIVSINYSFISTQTIKPPYLMIVLSFLISFVITYIICCFDKRNNPLVPVIVFLSIALVMIGVLQGIDQTFSRETELVNIAIVNKYIYSSRIGLHDYIIETEKYGENDCLEIYVNRREFEQFEEGDRIEIVIRKGLFGTQYFDLKNNN